MEGSRQAGRQGVREGLRMISAFSKIHFFLYLANCPNRPFSLIDTKCTVNKPDCSEIVCQKDILNTNLKINLKIKKCNTPILMEVMIETTSYEWFEKFTSSRLSRDIPHSGNPNTKLRLRVSLDNTTSSIGFKVKEKM